ncbi:MAG TPA: discoidin domain-containing protein, partial [Intrasporangium sp.]|nr:discoidin domain-containing protein [Intrasporangium sp.]
RAAIIGSDRDALGILTRDLPEVLTDGPRRREVTFGKAVANTSEVLAVDDPGRTGRRTIDYVSDDGAGQSVLEWSGIKAVRASSSASDAGASLRLGPAYGPAAALDGDPTTRWVSGTFLSAVGEWLEVELERPREIPSLTVELSSESPVAADPVRVAVDTDEGSIVSDVVSGRPWSLAVPPGESGRVRIRLVETGAGVQNGFAIAEVAIPGLEARSRLTLPASARGLPSVVLLRQQNPGTTGCHFVDERPLCAGAFVRPSEEPTGIYRAFATTDERSYAWSGTVLPRGGTAADRLLDAPGRIEVTATSRRVPGLAGRPGAIVDADLGTGWVAAESDELPSLTLTLPSKRTMTGLQFLVDAALAGSRPTKVLVSTPAGEKYSRSLDAEGRVGIPPTKTNVLSVTFLEDDETVSVDDATAVRSFLPVGVSELRLEGADDLRRPVELSSGVGTACGFGPTLTVDGVTWSTRVVGTVRQALRGEPMTWVPCGADAGERVSLGAGVHRVDADATTEFTPHELTLTTSSPRLLSTRVAVGGDASSVLVGPRSEAGILITTHNFNEGWSATDGSGAPLTPVRVNGRQQGWVLASGDGTTVNAVFAPQRWYATGLGVGAVTWLGVAALVLMTRRQQRRAMPPLPRAPRIGWLMAGVLISLLVVNAGLLGAAAGLTAGAVAAIARRQRWVPIVGIALGLLAVLLVAAQPWGRGAATLDSPLVAYSVWTAVGVTVLAPITWRGPRHAVRDA